MPAQGGEIQPAVPPFHYYMASSRARRMRWNPDVDDDKEREERDSIACYERAQGRDDGRG